MTGRVVCAACYTLVIWVTTKAGPVFWCPCCRRDCRPEDETLIHPYTP